MIDESGYNKLYLKNRDNNNKAEQRQSQLVFCVFLNTKKSMIASSKMLFYFKEMNKIKVHFTL